MLADVGLIWPNSLGPGLVEVLQPCYPLAHKQDSETRYQLQVCQECGDGVAG